MIVEARDADEGGVLWRIQDGGRGLSEEDLASLGRQGSPSLGLWLAWTIIERHDGRLRFESTVGLGTTASVWLPGSC